MTGLPLVSGFPMPVGASSTPVDPFVHARGLPSQNRMRKRGAFNHGFSVALPLLTFCQQCCFSWAQVWRFENFGVPRAHAYQPLWLYFVYAYNDAPDNSKGPPYVSFTDFEAKPLSPERSNSESAVHKGLQVTMMRYKDYWNIDPRHLCSTQDDVVHGRSSEIGQLVLHPRDYISPVEDAAEAEDVYAKMIPLTKTRQQPQSMVQTINRTDVYVLVLSNCGDFAAANLSGTVTVRNAYGFLPGNEYPKLPFYSGLLMAYGALLMIWLVLLRLWYNQLFRIHTCMTVVIFGGLAEALLWKTFYHHWNTVGTATTVGIILFVTATLSTVVKSVFSYALVLVASLGWGITRPRLGRNTVIKVALISFLYIVLGFIRQVVLDFRHSYSISLTMVLLCFVPVSVLNAIIFCWVFSALGALMETLKETKQTEKFQLFTALFAVLVAAVGVATLSLLVEIYNLSRSITNVWKHQWMLTDGVSHLLFLFVLAAMMYLWAPNANSQRYAYSEQVDTTDADGEGKLETNSSGAMPEVADELHEPGSAFSDVSWDGPNALSAGSDPRPSIVGMPADSGGKTQPKGPESDFV